MTDTKPAGPASEPVQGQNAPTPADRAELRDSIRALALLEAADFLRDAHFRDRLSVQEIGTALRHTADNADPTVGSLARDGFGLDEIAAMLDVAVLPASADRAAVLREAADALAAYIDRYRSPSIANWTGAVAFLRRMADEARDEREAQANLDTLADEVPCCSDPTCACDEVNAAGRCDCTRWDSAPADEAPQSEVTTAERAAALGMTDTEYRAASHRAAEEAVRAAAKGLYAEVGLRVMDALSETQQPECPAAVAQQPSGPQQCGHDDYHDGHEWADRPDVWCPGHSYAADGQAAEGAQR